MARTIVPPARPARTDVDIPTVVSQVQDWLEHFQADSDKADSDVDDAYYQGNINMCQGVLGLLTEDDSNTVANAERRENLDNTEVIVFGRETSKHWSATREYNVMFLRQQEQYLNKVLRDRHHVLVNDVREALGLPRTPSGAITGWLVRRDGIEFGLFGEGNQLDYLISTDDPITITLHHHGVIYKEI